MKPVVAIVGRPNVGKSTFFNKMAGRRVSIVEDVPGVTRDRITVDVEWLGHSFTLIDTGGIDPKSDDALLSQMREQAEIAMDMADVICFFTDARDGLTDDDREVALLLRKTHKPVLLSWASGILLVSQASICLVSEICWISLFPIFLPKHLSILHRIKRKSSLL